jgi:hypothetical protein
MMAKKNIIFKLITLQLILMVQLSSCQRMKTAKTDGYDWIPTIGAPKEYPIIIIKGEFITGENSNVGLPICAFVHAGWGNSGCIMDKGPNKKPVPDSLSITWLSYAENKFYRGRFALPEQKISELFKKGFLDHHTNKQRNYDYLTLGMTPGGTVVLWLAGGHKQVEVGKFQAKEVQLTAQEFGADYAHIFKPGFAKNAYERNLPKELREKAEKEGFKTDQVDKWLKRYNWRFTANFTAAKFYEIYSKYLNAEEEEIFDASLLKNDFEQRAVPKEIDVTWIDQKGRKMITNIIFDETEIQSAFALIPHDGKAELHFEVDPNEYTVAVTLKTAGKEVKIIKQKSKTQHDSE